jgi:hypothetical protein
MGIGGLALVGVTACGIILDPKIEGSGNPETVSYDFQSFDRVDVSGAFDADITIADGPPSVEVTVDDNLVERLDVKVDDDELKVGMGNSNVSHDVNPTVVITLPSLRGLDLSGASSAAVQNLDEPELRLELSGAADAELQGDVDDLDIDASGASDLRQNGIIGVVTLEISGAGSADFSDATVGSASVDLSGASSAEFGDLAEISGELSGGSSLSVPNGADVSVDTSGGSTVDRS